MEARTMPGKHAALKRFLKAGAQSKPPAHQFEEASRAAMPSGLAK
jgi:hypothetical protein